MSWDRKYINYFCLGFCSMAFVTAIHTGNSTAVGVDAIGIILNILCVLW